MFWNLKKQLLQSHKFPICEKNVFIKKGHRIQVILTLVNISDKNIFNICHPNQSIPILFCNKRSLT